MLPPRWRMAQMSHNCGTFCKHGFVPVFADFRSLGLGGGNSRAAMGDHGSAKPKERPGDRVSTWVQWHGSGRVCDASCETDCKLRTLSKLQNLWFLEKSRRGFCRILRAFGKDATQQLTGRQHECKVYRAGGARGWI